MSYDKRFEEWVMRHRDALGTAAIALRVFFAVAGAGLLLWG